MEILNGIWKKTFICLIVYHSNKWKNVSYLFLIRIEFSSSHTPALDGFLEFDSNKLRNSIRNLKISLQAQVDEFRLIDED